MKYSDSIPCYSNISYINEGKLLLHGFTREFLGKYFEGSPEQ